MRDMMSEIQNPKSKTKMMSVTKAVLVGATMILGLAAIVGWLSQEAEAAKCLDCGEQVNSGSPNPASQCPQLLEGICGGETNGVLIADEPYFCSDCVTRPVP